MMRIMDLWQRHRTALRALEGDVHFFPLDKRKRMERIKRFNYVADNTMKQWHVNLPPRRDPLREEAYGRYVVKVDVHLDSEHPQRPIVHGPAPPNETLIQWLARSLDTGQEDETEFWGHMWFTDSRERAHRAAHDLEMLYNAGPHGHPYDKVEVDITDLGRLANPEIIDRMTPEQYEYMHENAVIYKTIQIGNHLWHKIPLPEHDYEHEWDEDDDEDENWEDEDDA